MYNLDVRNAIKQHGFFNYEVASVLGVSETHFSRKLARSELPTDQKEHIFRTLEKMDIYRMEAVNT
jgi:predicted XRE-type DNA-binding protein